MNLHPTIADIEVPRRMRALPLNRAGYPVPWFVAWIDGAPDFRIIGPGKIRDAVRWSKCWLCGEPLGRYQAFTIGPMCAVNRTSAEPPSHGDCAVYAARACPFLANPARRRREAHKPDGTVDPPGITIRRNPGVALVWTTHRYRRKSDGEGGLLFDIGDPVEVAWFAEGRPATRAEILESIRSGLPQLRDLAVEDGPDAVAYLDRCVDEVERLLVPA